MKAAVAVAMREMIRAEFGDDVWQRIAARCGMNADRILLPISDIDEGLWQQLRKAAEIETGLSSEQMGLKFGETWVNVFTPRVYGAYYIGHKSARELLLDLDRIHLTVTKNIEGATPPRLHYEWEDERTLVLHYSSQRNMIDYLIGGIHALGRKYGESIEVQKIDESRVRVKFEH
jgi:hypothetical protein